MIRRQRCDGSRQNREFVVTNRPRRRRRRGDAAVGQPRQDASSSRPRPASARPVIAGQQHRTPTRGPTPAPIAQRSTLSTGRIRRQKKPPVRGRPMSKPSQRRRGAPHERPQTSQGEPALSERAKVKELTRQVSQMLGQKYMARSSLRSVYRAWDQDGDGSISAAEFESVLRTMGITLPRKAIEGVYRQFDRNGSGEINYSEFVKALDQGAYQHALGEGAANTAPPTPEERLKMLRQRAKMLNIDLGERGIAASAQTIVDTLRQRYKAKGSLRDVFRAWDLNKDGVVSPAELKHAMHCIGLPLTLGQANELVSLCDADNDGTIQYDDFIELVYGSTTAAEEEASVWRVAQPNPVTQYEQEQIAALHDRVSKAKQGPSAHTVTDRVTDLRVELATKIAERGMNLRELFNKCDKDGDGTVSYDEYRATLRELGVGRSRLDLDLLIAAADRDGEGRIEYPELVSEIEACKFAIKSRPKAGNQHGAMDDDDEATSQFGNDDELSPQSPGERANRPSATIQWAGMDYPRTPMRVSHATLRNLGGDGVVVTAALDANAKSGSAANLIRIRDAQRSELLRPAVRVGRQRPTSAPASRRRSTASTPGTTGGRSRRGSTVWETRRSHDQVSNVTATGRLFSPAGHLRRSVPRDEEDHGLTMAGRVKAAETAALLKSRAGSFHSPKRAGVDGSQGRPPLASSASGFFHTQDMTLRSQWLQTTASTPNLRAKQKAGATAAVHRHGRHAHTPHHDTRYLIKPPPTAPRSAFTVEDRERFNPMSTSIGATKQNQLYRDAAQLKKQRAANRLQRIRANQARVQAKSAEAQELSAKAQDRRLKTVLRQQLQYQEALAVRLADKHNKDRHALENAPAAHTSGKRAGIAPTKQGIPES